jgi:hypothetical protein
MTEHGQRTILSEGKIKYRGYLQTGQTTCRDENGNKVPCKDTGQDGESRRGIPWPDPRFQQQGYAVLDLLTGLTWSRNANLAEIPMSWQEALEFINRMNMERVFGFNDWRLPNRRELRSLMSYQSKKPALPEGHPFVNIFSGWYWTSTTAAINTAYAWYIHMEGARMFYGEKRQFFLIWPVRGRGYDLLPVTGQSNCYDIAGQQVPCRGSGQDGEFCCGRPWPSPRFEVSGDRVIDRVTGLCWMRDADISGKTVTWVEALEIVKKLNRDNDSPLIWRLPNINELESLIDSSTHSPSLPTGHPFENVREGYWSSTTSMYEPDWAWAMYLTKGALGVGQKKGPYFHVWPVCSLSR